MTSRARVLRITSGSLVLAFLMLTAGPHPVARAQHGAQIEKSCVNAARRACLQGTTAGCPGVNAGAPRRGALEARAPGRVHAALLDLCAVLGPGHRMWSGGEHQEGQDQASTRDPQDSRSASHGPALLALP